MPGTAVHCVPESMPSARLAERTGYRTVPLAGPYDVMLTAPAGVRRCYCR